MEHGSLGMIYRRALTGAAAIFLAMQATFAEDASVPLQVVEQTARQPLVQPTGITRGEYLRLMAGDLDYFRQFQRADGAILDPVTHREVQYSTPAFAAAAGVLVTEAGRKDLLEPGSRALGCSIGALLAKTTADRHADFYIPLIMQAYGELRESVDPAQRARWEEQLRRIDPRKVYRADLKLMNWNLVSFCGESLRARAGLVSAEKLADERQYLEESIAGHLPRLTKFGMYEDPNAPLAYDAFGRLWLEEVFAARAYDGPLAERLQKFLTDGGIVSLLLLSPTGEWASGGRSAFHQWNEAELAAICEMEAVRSKAAGQLEMAGSFKRAAHLAVQSIGRWKRPDGQLWIVKNRAAPTERLGFESYSYESQYNLLPMAMLGAAYRAADESIVERPTPSESGAYVLDLRETFHKIAAAAGGYYVLIDTSADPHYNATGLQRIQRAGAAFSPLSDSTAGERAYGPAKVAKLALAAGIQWKEQNGAWEGLADYSHPANGGGTDRLVKDVILKVLEQRPGRAAFAIDYTLARGETLRHVVEEYAITDGGVELTVRAPGATGELRLCMPALVSDGASPTKITCEKGSATIAAPGGVLRCELLGALAEVRPRLESERTVSHQGEIQPLVAELPGGTAAAEGVHCRWTLSAQ
jgi:hypothetical protein